jgi:hypothetical protein
MLSTGSAEGRLTNRSADKPKAQATKAQVHIRHPFGAVREARAAAAAVPSRKSSTERESPDISYSYHAYF